MQGILLSHMGSSDQPYGWLLLQRWSSIILEASQARSLHPYNAVNTDCKNSPWSQPYLRFPFPLFPFPDRYRKWSVTGFQVTPLHHSSFQVWWHLCGSFLPSRIHPFHWVLPLSVPWTASVHFLSFPNSCGFCHIVTNWSQMPVAAPLFRLLTAYHFLHWCHLYLRYVLHLYKARSYSPALCYRSHIPLRSSYNSVPARQGSDRPVRSPALLHLEKSVLLHMHLHHKSFSDWQPHIRYFLPICRKPLIHSSVLPPWMLIPVPDASIHQKVPVTAVQMWQITVSVLPDPRVSRHASRSYAGYDPLTVTMPEPTSSYPLHPVHFYLLLHTSP